MTAYEKMALKLMPYTCPTLDKMAREHIRTLEKHKDINLFMDLIEEIKKEITCPMRTALEKACKRIQELEEKLKNGS